MDTMTAPPIHAVRADLMRDWFNPGTDTGPGFILAADGDTVVITIGALAERHAYVAPQIDRLTDTDRADMLDDIAHALTGYGWTITHTADAVIVEGH